MLSSRKFSLDIAADSGEPVKRAVDLVHLSHHTLGNRELEREILKLFAKQSKIYLERLVKAQSLQDWFEAAHILKGSARGIGAWDVVRLAEKAENLKSSGKSKSRTYTIERLTEAVGEVNAFIRDMLSD